MPLNLVAIATLRARILDATAEAAAETILPKSNEYIPKDTETAEHSGRVVIDGDRVVVTYGLDDDANPKTGEPSNTYIEVLEEDSEARHTNGQAHFLRRAADESVAGFVGEVARRVRFQ